MCEVDYWDFANNFRCRSAMNGLILNTVMESRVSTTSLLLLFSETSALTLVTNVLLLTFRSIPTRPAVACAPKWCSPIGIWGCTWTAHWSVNTEAVYRKGRSRLFLPRKLRSFNVCCEMLHMISRLWLVPFLCR